MLELQWRCIVGKALCGPHLDMQSAEPFIIMSRGAQHHWGTRAGVRLHVNSPYHGAPRADGSFLLSSVLPIISAGEAIVPKHTVNVPSSSTAALTRTGPRR